LVKIKNVSDNFYYFIMIKVVRNSKQELQEQHSLLLAASRWSYIISHHTDTVHLKLTQNDISSQHLQSPSMATTGWKSNDTQIKHRYTNPFQYKQIRQSNWAYLYNIFR